MVADDPSLRVDYQGEPIELANCKDDPMEELGIWLKASVDAGIELANAVTLATTVDGRPSVRIVLVKSLDTGVVFFTNYRSRKAVELTKNPNAALLFFWPQLSRQVRLEGTVSKVTRKESEDYFASRPRGSQLSAAVSPQSTPIESLDDLTRSARELDRRLADAPIPCPADWGGFRLTPYQMEFWQGRPDRLHDRIVYTKPPRWIKHRLAP